MLPSMKTRTVAPGSPVPENVGESVERFAPDAGATSTGVPGGTVSMFTLKGVLAGDVLPTPSTARAEIVCEP